MQSGGGRRSIGRGLSWLAAICLALAGATQPAEAQVAAGYSEYYIPGDEAVMRYVFDDLDDAGGSYGMHAVVAVTAWSAGTTVYYDHWEDAGGYDFDPANPSTADETVLLANAGDRRVFESANIPTNPRGTGTYYDGGDRIYVAGGTVTVTRASWIEAVGVGNQSAAWEIYPVKPQLTTYVVPFGENLPFNDFDRVYVLIQATAPGTTVTVDVNGDGTPDQLDTDRNGTGDATTVALQQGRTFLLDRVSARVATLGTGVVVQGSATLQVKFVAGDAGENYCARGLSAFPRGFWTREYYAPLDQPTSGNGDTDYYLYNPHASAITVIWESLGATGSFDIPALSTVSFRTATGGSVPTDSGLFFRGSDVFWGVGVGDAEANAYEWGFSLLPSTFLHSEHFLGWAPGSSPLDGTGNPGNQDNDGVFLSVAQDNTRVFVDFDNDGASDLVDADGDGTPESAFVALSRLQTQFFYDPGDGDLSRAHFWATGPFTLSYGENADTATTSSPSLDLGYVAIPATDFVSLVLTVDKAVSPQVVPTASGSVATFTVRVESQKYTVDDVSVTDVLPPGWGYVVGTDTTTIVRSDRTTSTGTGADPAGSGTLTSLAWSSAQLGGDMAENQEITITFTARTTAVLPAGTLSTNRVRAVGTRTVAGSAQTFTATDFTFVASGGLAITKTSAAPDPAYPGDTFAYTVTVTNPAGSPTLTGVSLYDALPAGVQGTGTTTLSRSTVADRFQTQAYSRNDGTRTWGANWVEANDGGGATSGYIMVTTGGELSLNNDGASVPRLSRRVDTTGASSIILSFRYRTSGVEAGDSFLVQAGTAGTGGGAAFTTLPGGTVTGAGSGVLTFDISSYVSANTAVRFTFPAGGYEGGNDFVYVDDLSITYSLTATGGNPPDLLSSASLYALAAGQSVSATFSVTVDDPLAAGITSLANTASASSVDIPMQVSATVSDPVANPSVLSATVAGRIWYDADAGADQDIGEPGIGSVEVTLKDRFGTPLATLLTDTTGRFLFTGVPAGTGYYVEVTDGLPAGLSKTFPTSVAGDRTTAFDLADGQVYTLANVGYRADAALGNAAFGDLAWVDADSDGVRDAGEIGLASLAVTLYRDSNANGRFDDGVDTAVASTTTGSDGSYLFVPTVTVGGTYFVVATTPGSPTPTHTPTTPTVYPFTGVTAGSSYLTADFGFASIAATYSIRDRVWVDADAGGDLDGGEGGVGGVTVQLLDASLNVIATTTTAADGTFSFTGVTGGGADYTVRLSDTGNVLADYAGTTASALVRERDVDNLSASVDWTAAPSFGFRTARSIGDTVWSDIDGDGTQDAGEPGMAGIVVSLYADTDNDNVIDAGDPLVGTVTTDAGGQYLFAGLDDGNYIVSVPTPAGYTFRGPGTDTDAAFAGIQKGPALAGSNVLDVDFGFQAAVQRTLSGRLWNDADRDGVIDAGESGIAGVTVDVLQGTTVVATLTTDTTGTYQAAGLTNTTYTVRVTDLGSALTGYTPTYEVTGGTGGPFDYQESVSLVVGNVSTVHFGYARPVPTYAAVSWLGALVSDGSVVVEWRTTLEQQTAGFHVLRLDPGSRAWQRVNERLVPGLVVHPRGGTYRLRDAAAPTEGRALYRLVEVDVRGTERAYGPFEVVLGGEATAARAENVRSAMVRADRAGQAFDREPARPARRGHPAARLRSAGRPVPRLVRPGPAVKVTTREAGLHYVPAEQLAALLGRPLPAMAELARAGGLSLTSQGRRVPYLAAPGGAGLYFYAVPVESPYTRDNAYRVAVGRGVAMAGHPSAEGGPLADSFDDTVHREEDRYPLLTYFQDPEADFWTWEFLFAGYDGLDASTATIPVRDLALSGGEASLTVHLMGGTDASPGADHRVQVFLNHRLLGEASWDGIALHDETFTLAPGDLQEGDNTVEVRALLDGGVSESIVFLDSFDLSYPRRYRAVAGALTFDVADGASASVSGFASSSVIVLDVTDPAVPVAIVGLPAVPAGDGSYAVRLAAPAGGGTRRYHAVAAGGAKEPLALGAWLGGSLRRGGLEADYLLVAPESLAGAAQSLADYREGQGLSTRVVAVESIVDEFNRGLFEPAAVREFLRFASRGAHAPRYVTLVGRGTWDYLDHNGVGDNLVPTALAATPSGLVASDTALADIAGDDGVPEIAIGRLPVVTSAEILAYLDKVRAHEAAPAAPWQRHALLVADDPDAGGNFPEDSERLAAVLPAGHTVERAYMPDLTPAAARQAILDTVGAGASLFHYLGHGAPDRLAEESLLTVSDVASLANGERLTLFVALTCSSADYAAPGTPSLGEAMLVSPAGGAHTVWGPSGLSYNALAVTMGEAFLRSLYADEGARIGDAAIAGLSAAVGPDAPAMRRMYNVLGEPVSRLPVGPESPGE
jgi:uncharacterized repeat protein (TIGR01451 family)